ncbi:MAG: hypothetical protein ABI343_10950 [Burkholderiaceae bacterium]
MEALHLIRTASWFLGCAAVAGVWMAILRFAKDRAPPRLLAKAHTLLTCASVTLLTYEWATAGLPRLASISLALLWLGALLGFVASRTIRLKWVPTIETLVFAHLSIAATALFFLIASAARPAGLP